MKSPLNGSIQLSVIAFPARSLPHFSVITIVSAGFSNCDSESPSAARQEAHEAGLPYVTDAELSARLTAAKATPERAWLSDVPAVALQQAQADLNAAYRNFFASLKGEPWETHEYSLVWLPKMLGAVAEHHPGLLARCFDMLWSLGKDKPVAEFHNNQSHPLAARPLYCAHECARVGC